MVGFHVLQGVEQANAELTLCISHAGSDGF